MANLIPNQHVYVKGAVQYSNISQLVDGDRLAARNQNRKYNLNPYVSVTVIDPEIITIGDEMNESSQSVKENRFYTTKKEPDTEHFEGMSQKYPASKHFVLPWVATTVMHSHVAKEHKLTKHQELKRGQEVILCLRTFQGSGNVGMSLDGVLAIIPENTPVEDAFETFGANNSITSDLRELGLTLENPPKDEPNDQPVRKINASDLPTGMTADKSNEKQDSNAAKSETNQAQETTDNSSTADDPWTEWDGTGDDSDDSAAANDSWFDN